MEKAKRPNQLKLLHPQPLKLRLQKMMERQKLHPNQPKNLLLRLQLGNLLLLLVNLLLQLHPSQLVRLPQLHQNQLERPLLLHLQLGRNHQLLLEKLPLLLLVRAKCPLLLRVLPRNDVDI